MAMAKTVSSKLYRHYKNKFYKYIGEVVHSESLERLTLYETRYPNDLSKTWVRPKELFESEIEVDGQSTRRFAPVDFDLVEQTSLTDETLVRITALLQEVFGAYQQEKLEERLANKKSVLFLGLYQKDQLVGFKLGYAIDSSVFYSWLGAVHPEFRGVGLAQALIDQQHAWARNNGFTKVQTKTLNQWKSMLLLNIRNDFQIVGTEPYVGDGHKIVLEKPLSE